MTILKTSDPQWVQIHRVADKMEPKLRKAFLEAFEALAGLVPIGTLTDLIEAEDVAGIGRIVQQLDLPNPTVVTSLLTDTATDAAKITATGLDMSFTLDNPAVERWAAKYTGDLITGVTNETKLAVREIVRSGFVEGIPPRTQARQIRRIVGLTERDAGVVDRFLRGQLENGIATKRAEQQADRMAARLLRRRAETIARTESIKAANRGQYVAWQDAADQGLIDRTRTRVVWVATTDKRICAICAVLDGKTVKFGDQFTSNVQAVDYTSTNGTITVATTKPLKTPIVEQTPPAHPRCRCSLGLVFD